MHLCINTSKPQHTCAHAAWQNGTLLWLSKDQSTQTQTHIQSLSLPEQTPLFTLTISHTRLPSQTHTHTPNYGPLIVRLSNNQDATSCAALAGFAFHTSLLFKDTQGREWNHLSQREAQRLEAPAAEKPVYFGWQNTLGYGCICVLMSVCIQACSCVYAEYIHFCVCDHPKEQLCLWIN